MDNFHFAILSLFFLFFLVYRARKLRPSLKVIVMSATLDVDKFSHFFDDCPVFSIPGRVFDVEIFYAKKMKFSALKSTYLQRAVDTCLHVHLNESPGDM